jgi:hypothetical protein
VWQYRNIYVYLRLDTTIIEVVNDNKLMACGYIFRLLVQPSSGQLQIEPSTVIRAQCVFTALYEVGLE